jgi:hypothetical protein
MCGGSGGYNVITLTQIINQQLEYEFGFLRRTLHTAHLSCQSKQPRVFMHNVWLSRKNCDFAWWKKGRIRAALRCADKSMARRMINFESHGRAVAKAKAGSHR